MQVKLLGPLEVEENGVSITPSAAKPRQLLTLLALHPGEVVAVSTLLEELWADHPPDSSAQTLQTYILHLRRRIASAYGPGQSDMAKKVLVTRHVGYLLNIAGEDLDVHRFERLAAAGERAAEIGDYESAARLLRAGLDVWRGPALVDLPRGIQLGIAVNRLEENRLGVLESRIEADLRLGRHHMLLGELAELTTRYPMHERLCSQYMIAQYRSGRQWRALEIFRALRHTLVDELGVEPSSRMQQLLMAILNSDPALDEPRRGGHLQRAAAS